VGIAHVQDTGLGTTAAAGSQQTGAFGSNPTVGNYVVAFAWGAPGSGTVNNPVSFSDSAGNTYTIPTNAYQFSSNSGCWCAVGYAKVGSTGASFKVTVTHGSGWTSGIICVVASEFSGVAASSPQDGSAVGQGSTSSASSFSPGTNSYSSTSLVVAVMVNNQGNLITLTDPSGYSVPAHEADGSSFEVGGSAYKIAPSGSQNPTWSQNQSANLWAAAQFGLLAGGSGSFSPWRRKMRVPPHDDYLLRCW
jgi:hypothetical protein